QPRIALVRFLLSQGQRIFFLTTSAETGKPSWIFTGQLPSGPIQQNANTRRSQSGNLGDFGMCCSFRVSKPEQLALARTHAIESASKHPLRIDMGNVRALVGPEEFFREAFERGGNAFAPMVSQKVCGNAKQKPSARGFTIA